MKSTKLNIKGMHCVGCQRAIEEGLKQDNKINTINIDLKNDQGTITHSEELSSQDIINKIKNLHYQAEVISDKKETSLWPLLIGAVVIFLLVFYTSKHYGWFSLLEALNEKHLSCGLIFIIGILASLHCVGMCGGLIMSYATKNTNSNKPHLQYNTGRIISYSIIGGLLGGIGSAFGINPVLSGVLVIVAGLFMSVFGLSFIFGFKLPSIKLPNFLKNNLNTSTSPLIVGLLTGLMPCGPLQAMQIYALGTGSVTKGFLSMAVYALGTTPLLFGFGKLISKINQSKISTFIKLSGIIVTIMGLTMLNRGTLNFGIGFTNDNIPATTAKNQEAGTNIQIIKMDLNTNGYSPNVLRIKPGVPVRWIINVKQMSGCTNAIILHGYDIEKKLSYGENIIEFTPNKNDQEIKFSCWMQMVWGKFVIDKAETCALSDAACTSK